MNNFFSDLKKNGFYIFRNIISNDEINFARSLVNDKTVDYFNIEKYIYNSILKRVPLECEYSKYRISNNNNSNDASALHRDLIVIDGQETPPIFTILNYLDKSFMELIPKSHLIIKCKYRKGFELFYYKKKFEIYPNDIVIFYSTIMHRGIFTNKNQKDRRLIQLFDCIPIKIFNDINPKILHLPCNNNCWDWFNNKMIGISKNPVLIFIINFINYFNVARGYGQQGTNYINIAKLHGYNNKYLSTESNNQRLYPKYNGFEAINKYIIKKNINDRHDKHTLSFRFFLYTFLNLIHTLIIISVIILIFLKIKNYRK